MSAGGGAVPASAAGSDGGAAELRGAMPAPGDGAEEIAEKSRGSQGRRQGQGWDGSMMGVSLFKKNMLGRKTWCEDIVHHVSKQVLKQSVYIYIYMYLHIYML